MTALHTTNVPTLPDTMSTGDRDRAYALREYKRLRASMRHSLALADHPRTGLDTKFRCYDHADECERAMIEIDRDWHFTNRFTEAG